MITLTCSSCGQTVNFEDHLAGKTDVCPQCGGFQQIPALIEEPPSIFGKVVQAEQALPGQRNRYSERLWSSYGRDALFIAVLAWALLFIAGTIVAGILAVIALVLAIRAIPLSASRSQLGLGMSIGATVLAIVLLLFIVTGFGLRG